MSDDKQSVVPGLFDNRFRLCACPGVLRRLSAMQQKDIVPSPTLYGSSNKKNTFVFPDSNPALTLTLGK